MKAIVWILVVWTTNGHQGPQPSLATFKTKQACEKVLEIVKWQGDQIRRGRLVDGYCVSVEDQ
jgi:hypothetical protein